MSSKLTIVPISLREANAFVEVLHRNHRPVNGAKFAIAVALGDEIVGVAIVGGRPFARADRGFEQRDRHHFGSADYGDSVTADFTGRLG